MPEAFLLAAGESRRMGSPKPLLPFGDSTVLAVMARAFRLAGYAPIWVVHRAEDTALVEASVLLGLYPVANLDPAPGMSSSIAVAASTATADWLALCPCDMPLLTSGTLARLAEALEGCEAASLQPTVEGRRKHPVLVKREWLLERGELLRADTPLRELLADSGGAGLEFADATEFLDFDTPEEYEALARLECQHEVEYPPAAE